MSTEAAKTPDAAKPTIVLVHGAFADSSGWLGVVKRLREEGLATIAFANPLRGLSHDAEHLRVLLGTITGRVVLVSHSYGGAVVTNAATGNANVAAIVYVNAFALAEGETVAEAIKLGGAHSELTQHILVRPIPGAAEGNGDAYLDPERFHQVFAQDMTAEDAAGLAATQRPAALATLGEPSGPPAWQTVDCWFLVSSGDRVLPPEAARFMAARADSHTVEIDSSHAAMITHPKAVAELVLDAVRAATRS